MFQLTLHDKARLIELRYIEEVFEDGSSFIATIQATPEGPQASFLIKCESGGTTLTETDIQLFQNMDAAMKWLDSAAAKRGFVNFPIHYT
jgi:hypothetical protein